VAIRKILKKEGPSGFLKGGVAVLLRDFPFGSIMWTSYTIINRFFEDLGYENKLFF